jgi:hypothetical protein
VNENDTKEEVTKVAEMLPFQFSTRFCIVRMVCMFSARRRASLILAVTHFAHADTSTRLSKKGYSAWDDISSSDYRGKMRPGTLVNVKRTHVEELRIHAYSLNGLVEESGQLRLWVHDIIHGLRAVKGTSSTSGTGSHNIRPYSSSAPQQGVGRWRWCDWRSMAHKLQNLLLTLSPREITGNRETQMAGESSV